MWDKFFSKSKLKKTMKKLPELKLRNKVILEASGRINSKNITKYAENKYRHDICWKYN
jgi:Nicotinate-nucleotide pyrophosphorylase